MKLQLIADFTKYCKIYKMTMINKLCSTSLLAIAAIVIVITIRTLTYGRKQRPVLQCTKSDLDFIPATDQVVGRFRKALQIQTVARKEHDYNRAELKTLVEFILSEYPALHSSPLVKHEVVANYSLLYTIRGSNPRLTPFLLMAHLDVVPAEPTKWQAPPFEARIVDEFIYARGTIDFKHGVMGILEAAEYLVSEGRQPQRGFYIAFGHDEEVGGADGATAIGDLLWEHGLRNIEFIIDEGLTVVNDLIPGVIGPAALIGTAEKGQVMLELSVEAAPGHSSMPLRHSTIGILAAAITRLENSPQPSMFGYGPEIETLTCLAPYMTLPFRVVMSNLWLFGPVVSWGMSLKPHTNAMIRTVTAVTMIKAGIKINVIAPSAKAYINHRIHPAQTVQQVVDYDRYIINDDRVQLTVLHEMESHPIAPSGENDFGYQIIQSSIRQVFNNSHVAPATMIGNTDTKHYLRFTKNVYRFSPTVMFPGDPERFHGDNERISVRNYEQAVNFYYHVMKNADIESLEPIHKHGEL